VIAEPVLRHDSRQRPGIRVVRAAVQALHVNSVSERFLGSVRCECLDRLVIISEWHVRHILAEYALSLSHSTRLGPISGSAYAFRYNVNASGPVRWPDHGAPVLGGLSRDHDYRTAA
jgi:hypothetical protein